MTYNPAPFYPSSVRRCAGMIIMVFFVSLGNAESYWVRYGWQVFNSAGDARILSLGGAAVTDYGTAISPLFNPAASNRVGLHNINYTHQSRLAGMINSDLIGLPIKNFSRPFNLIILHEGIDQIPDTRDILLDFGVDGIPGTGDVGEGNGDEYRMYFKVENLKVLKGTYDVSISSRGISHWVNNDIPLEYWIALEPDSEYGDI